MKSLCIKKRETLTVCLAIGVVAGGVLGASAQRQQTRGAEKSATVQQEQIGRQHQVQPGQRPGVEPDAQQAGRRKSTHSSQGNTMVRASQLLTMPVHGQDGRKLGTVDEVILGQDRRSVEHIKVSLDGGNSVLLSLDELSVKHGDDDARLVRVSQQDLRQRQTTNRDQVRIGRAQNEQSSRQLSSLIGLDVQGTDGNKVGNINDLILDTQNGQIKTAAVQTGGILGLGARLTSVEWQQVNVAADGDSASINMSKDKLSDGAYKRAEYWERHASERVDSQRGLQHSDIRQGTSGVESRQGQIQGQTDEQQHRSGMTRVRDRHEARPTSFDQGNSRADTDTTAQIRQDIMATENMSMSGKNVTVITRDGRVMLRGQVANMEEKQIIGDIANRIARPENVDNQLEVRATAVSAN